MSLNSIKSYEMRHPHTMDISNEINEGWIQFVRITKPELYTTIFATNRVHFGGFYPVACVQYHTWDILYVNHTISESFNFDVNMILSQW